MGHKSGQQPLKEIGCESTDCGVPSADVTGLELEMEMILERADRTTSASGRFLPIEMEMILGGTAEQLIRYLQKPDGQTVFRALYELFAHGDYEKLRMVDANPVINRAWKHTLFESISPDSFRALELGFFLSSSQKGQEVAQPDPVQPISSDWGKSATEGFSPEELAQLRDLPAEDLIEALLQPSGLKAIWALYELLEHGELQTLRTVGSNPAIKELYQGVSLANSSPETRMMDKLNAFFSELEAKN